jgi:hypothetical protein
MTSTLPLPYDIPVCWGVSLRNSERTRNRNEAHTEFIYKNVKGISNTPFIYQFCGHENRKGQCVVPKGERTKADEEYSCRTVTAIVVPFSAGSFDLVAAERVKAIGVKMKVPVFFVYHHPFDYNYDHTIELEVWQPNGEHTYHALAKWRRDLLTALLDTQIEHESKHNCFIDVPEGQFDWLDGNGDTHISDDPEVHEKPGVDLTLSGILRLIPGVRHLDVDACVTCDLCNQPIALIEASSDGYSRGRLADKKKTAAMTLKLGAALDVPTIKLLHEATADVHNDSGADITTWKPGQTWDKDGRELSDPKRDIDMEDALDIMDGIVAKHLRSAHSE